MANEQWTEEQEESFQRVKNDYDALNAQRNRVAQQNRARLVIVSDTILKHLPAEDISAENVADELQRNAYNLRAALAPFDRGPPPQPQAVEE